MATQLETKPGRPRRKTSPLPSQPAPFNWVKPSNVEVEEDPLQLSVDFHHETTVVHDYAKGRVSRTWVVSASDIAHALARELDLSTGLLGRETLWWNKRADGVTVAVWQAARVWTLGLNEGPGKPLKRYEMPMPGLVFLRLANGQIYVFAAKERPVRDNAQLYHCPTLNVYETGAVCVGSHRFPADPWKLPTAFFESYFSQNHLGTGKSAKHPKDITRLWEELNGAKRFPVDDLVPHMLVADAMTIGMDVRNRPGGVDDD
ncbi:MAG: hypothetical protein KGJ86_00695 [Chloroflexota bacterium]|nr:hypothetical protein [Chloroflexota bacterium]